MANTQKPIANAQQPIANGQQPEEANSQPTNEARVEGSTFPSTEQGGGKAYKVGLKANKKKQKQYESPKANSQ